MIKLLSRTGFNGAVPSVLFNGVMQMLFTISLARVKKDNEAVLFGIDKRTSLLLVGRSITGFFGMFLAFKATERLPVGDATVLSMLSPYFASFLAQFVLNEPLRYNEMIAALFSFIGAIFLSHPHFLFTENNQFHEDSLGVVVALLASLASGNFLKNNI
jgi:drug/metabolite transporter (DMT)-like permease